jgi:hypothetical protein
MYTSPRLVQQQVAPATASLSPLLSSTSGATSHSASVCDDKVAVVELVRNNPTRQLIAIREPAADAHTPKVVRFLSPPQPYFIPSQRGQKRKGVSSAQRKLGAKPRKGMVSQDKFPSGKLPFVSEQTARRKD